MRVLIADDDAYVRRGLREIILEEYINAEVGEASNAKEAIRLVRKQRSERFWDLMVLDISMPGGSGLEVLKEFKNNFRDLPILILSGHSEDEYAVRTLKAGAAGFLTKEAAPEELLTAIKRVLGGGRYISASVAEKLAFNLTNAEAKLPHESLSDRELEILRMIASGKEVGEIATELALSTKTISTYRARLLNKMNLSTNAQLILYSITHGLVGEREIERRAHSR